MGSKRKNKARTATFRNNEKVNNQAGEQIINGSQYYGTVNFVTQQTADAQPSGGSQDLTTIDESVLASLAFPDMLARRGNIEQEHPNTCHWLLDVDDYKTWHEQSYGLLWLKGYPGAGKSTLMSFLYGILDSHHRNEGVLRLDFFFSARGSDLQRTPLGMFRSLLNQLYVQENDIRSSIREMFTERSTAFGKSHGTWQWQQSDLEKLLKLAILEAAKRRSIILLVDALDEAGESSARSLATYFHRLNDQIMASCLNVKICISCRHFPVVAQHNALEIDVENHTRQDIATYVKDTLSQELLSDLQGPERKAWQDLEKDITERARGIFMWARLVVPMVCKYIQDGRSFDEMRDKIRKVPPDLGDVYRHILSNIIDREDRGHTFRLFQWILLAKRQLSVTEMRYAMATADVSTASRSTTNYKPMTLISTDQRMQLRIRALSGGLAEVATVELEEIVATSATQHVQFIHQSVIDFLLADGLLYLYQLQSEDTDEYPHSHTGPSNDFIIKFSQAVIYRCCLNDLCTSKHMRQVEALCSKHTALLDDIDPSREDDKEEEEEEEEDYYLDHRNFPLSLLPNIALERSSLLQAWPLLNYAGVYTFEHAEEAGQDRFQQFEEEMEFLEHITAIWPMIRQVLGKFKSGFSVNYVKIMPKNPKILHIAGLANMTDILVEKIQQAVNLDVEDDAGWTPLHVSASCGHQQFVKALVEHGADLHAKTKTGYTAFELALWGGNIHLIEWFLGTDADRVGALRRLLDIIDLDDVRYEMKVQALIKSGVDLNTRAESGRTLLHYAVQGDNLVLIEALLTAGVDVNVYGGSHGFPLQIAIFQKSVKIVQLLLEHGAEVNVEITEGDTLTALQAAAQGGDEMIVKMLLDSGAHVNIQCGRHGAALYRAALFGEKSMVKLLLDAGADVNRPGGFYGSALNAFISFCGRSWHVGDQYPARGFIQETVLLLLEAGADLNIEGLRLGNALQTASYYGVVPVIRILLDHGADVNAKSQAYPNALQAVVRAMQERQISWADSVPDLKYEEIVKILVDAGTNRSSTITFPDIDLLTAAYYGRADKVQDVLATHHDATQRGVQYAKLILAAFNGSVLKFAGQFDKSDMLQRSYMKIIELLLHARAVECVEDNEFWYMLQQSVTDIHQSTFWVRTLLESGKKMEAHNHKCRELLKDFWSSWSETTKSNNADLEMMRLLVDAGAGPLLKWEHAFVKYHMKQ